MLVLHQVDASSSVLLADRPGGRGPRAQQATSSRMAPASRSTPLPPVLLSGRGVIGLPVPWSWCFSSMSRVRSNCRNALRRAQNRSAAARASRW